MSATSPRGVLPPAQFDGELCEFLKPFYDRDHQLRRERNMLPESLSSVADYSPLEHLLALLATPPSLTTIRYNTLRFASAETAEQRLSEFLRASYADKCIPAPAISRHAMLADILTVPCAGPRQIPSLPRQVIVDPPCGMAVLRGADVYAPGIISAPDGPAGQDVSVVVDVDRKCQKGARLSRPFDLGRSFTVGNGRLVIAREELFCGSPRRGVAVVMTVPLYDSPSFGSDKTSGSGDIDGLFFLQNAPSAAAAHALDPRPGERVLDMCAAPGGKTAHIGALMRNRGLLVAMERSKPKVAKLVENVSVWGVMCARVLYMDATRTVDLTAIGGRHGSQAEAVEKSLLSADGVLVDKKTFFPAGFFDRVLCDVPCSALGQRPQTVNPMDVAALRGHAPYQRKLLAVALKAVRPGGVVVYSTCTINPEENESVVGWALENHPGLALAETSGWGAGPGMLGCGLKDEDAARVMRFDPRHDPATIGFFCAKFIAPK